MCACRCPQMCVHVSMCARVHVCESRYEHVGLQKCIRVPVSRRGLEEEACMWGSGPSSGAVCRLASIPQEVSRWRKRATGRVWVEKASGLFSRWP